MAAADNSLIPALIGREDQLASLRKSLAEAAVGSGSVIVVAAEAGLGKSRLLDEAATMAQERGTNVLRGGGVERAEKVPNGLIAEVLSDLLESASDTEVAAVREAVAELMPHLWSMVFGSTPAPQDAGTEMPPELRQSLFLAKVTALLIERSRRQPVLVCLDDLHWADSASLHLLQPLSQQLADAALTVLVTLRPEESHEDGTQVLPRLQQTLSRLEEFQQIDLPPMTSAQTRAIVVSCFRREALSVEFFDMLHTRSGGVPLFVVQYLTFFLERGVVHEQHGMWINRRLDEGDVPESVRATIRQRIDKLTEGERDLLSLAAVQGSRFEGSLLAKAMAVPMTSMLRDLAELGRRTRLVQADGRAFRFSHPVLTDAFYQQLPARKRQHVHLRLAHILNRDRPDDSEQLAHHYYHAGRFELALPHLLQAARQARDSFALREARLYLTQAHTAFDACAGAASTLERLDAQLLQADVETLLGEYDPALAICRQVLEQAGAQSAIRARACLQMGLIHVYQASWDEAEEKYQRALELFSEVGDDLHCTRCYVGLGNMGFERSDLDAAQSHFTDARESVSRCGDDSLLGVILGNLGVVATVRGQYLEAVLHYTEALKAYSRARNRYGFCQTYHNLGMCYANQDDWHSAITNYEKGEELAIELGTIQVLANIRISRAVAELHSGRLDAAERLSLQAATLMEQLNDRLGLAECRKVEGMVLRERADYVESLRRLEEGLQMFRDLGNDLGVAECELELGLLERQRGAPGEARVRLSESVRLFRQIGADEDVRRGEVLLAEIAA